MALFPMPFAGHAKLTLENLGDAPVTVKVLAGFEPLPACPPGPCSSTPSTASTNMRPTATQNTPSPPTPPSTAATNYVVAEVQGAGHYIGTAIFVESVGPYWWGEGDEWTWVDGAEKPVILGTGTEDEFNWSWGFTAYQSPLSGTLPVVPPCKESIVAQVLPSLRQPGMRGHHRPQHCLPLPAHRLRGLQQVDQGELRGIGASMTPVNNPIKGNWSQWRGDDYSSMAYWYQAP